MNIILIGSGHVATVLGFRMRQAGHVISAVWGRNQEKAANLARGLGAALLPGIPETWPPESDLIFVAIKDEAYSPLAEILPATDKLILHCGGAVPGNIFHRVSARTGVLYPLQTIRSETSISSGLPLLIAAATSEDLSVVKTFALSLSMMVTAASDEVRLKYHLAAVFTANFANHLFSLAETFCINQDLDFKFLQPLLEETVLRMRSGSPVALQTGPAFRGDRETIEKHLLLLKDAPGMTAIYTCLSKSIMDFYS